MELLVGAPVSHREWIVREWVDKTVIAAAHTGLTPTFLVVCDPRDESLSELADECEKRRIELKHIMVEDDRREDVRNWSMSRYERMVYLRNQLLKGVRRLEPRWFLSLDTDILLHHEALSNMLETQQVEGWDAVGGKLYMSRRSRHDPSFAMLKRGGRIMRSESSNVMRVDVIMACKLMTKPAYSVDYRFDPQGEDIGWSKACREQRVVLGWDGRVVNKHVMDRETLNKVDERVGF